MPQLSGRYEGAGRRLHREPSGLFSGRHPCAWNLLSEVPGPVWVISTQPTPGTGALPVKSHSHPSPWPQRRWVEQLQLQSLEHPSYKCRQLCTRPGTNRNIRDISSQPAWEEWTYLPPQPKQLKKLNETHGTRVLKLMGIRNKGWESL